MVHVLVVDDDDDVRLAIRLALEDEGYTVLEARTGREALCILRATRQPLVALVDQVMPTMTGLALLRLISLNGDLARRHAFALVTASPSVVTADVAALAPVIGAGLLAKPFQLDDLFAVVARAAQRLEAGDPEAYS